MKVPFKGQLSNSARAITQRTWASMRDEEEQAIESAGTADRSAKYQLKKKLSKDGAYQSASQDQQKAMLSAAEEELAAKRFRACKSG